MDTSTHSAFTFSKSTIETLEQGVKAVQSYHKIHQKALNVVVLVAILLTSYDDNQQIFYLINPTFSLPEWDS